MTAPKFTLSELRAEVTQIANFSTFAYQNPDGSSACLYAHKDSEGELCSGCIFGRALNNLGVDLTELHRSGGFIDELLAENTWITKEGVKKDKQNLRWCCWFQKMQDMQVPWGKCLILTNEFCRELEREEDAN